MRLHLCFWNHFCLVYNSEPRRRGFVKYQEIMDSSDLTVSNIERFVQNRQAAEKEAAHEPLSATALHVYARRLDGTLQQLQDQVRRQEEELIKVRGTSH